MSTAILTLPRRRFSDSDLLLILIWGAMLTLSVAMPNLPDLIAAVPWSWTLNRLSERWL